MDEPKPFGVDEKCRLIVEALKEKKGHRITTIDLRETGTSVCDAFVICHGESTTQVGALAESVEKELRNKAKIRPHHVEGTQNKQWILLDYFDVLVHVFLEDFRSFFKLEELWADGKVTRVTEKS